MKELRYYSSFDNDGPIFFEDLSSLMTNKGHPPEHIRDVWFNLDLATDSPGYMEGHPVAPEPPPNTGASSSGAAPFGGGEGGIPIPLTPQGNRGRTFRELSDNIAIGPVPDGVQRAMTPSGPLTQLDIDRIYADPDKAREWLPNVANIAQIERWDCIRRTVIGGATRVWICMACGQEASYHHLASERCEANRASYNPNEVPPSRFWEVVEAITRERNIEFALDTADWARETKGSNDIPFIMEHRPKFAQQLFIDAAPMCQPCGDDSEAPRWVYRLSLIHI